MKICLGTDHNGFRLMQELQQFLTRQGHEVVNDGDDKLDPADDFPVFAAKVAKDVLSGDGQVMGILICGSGQGMCMAANRFQGIRACLGYSVEAARSSRNDDDSNILCLPADVLKNDQANDIVSVWLNTAFAAAPRFVRRIQEMDNL